MAEMISRVTVWSSRLRWTHASMGLSVLVLLLTGSLSQSDGSIAASARGYHYLAAYVFTFSLVYRVYLLLAGEKSERINDCLVAANRSEVVSQHLRFYLTLGKTDLPGWYAHNPFWGPLYLGVFVLCVFMVLTGFAIGNIYMGTAISLSGLHAFGAGLMLIFVGLHFYAVILHDVKAENTGISAIVSGNRYFTKQEQQPSIPAEFPITFTHKPANKKNL